MLVPNMVIAVAAGVHRRILWVHEKEGICWTFSLSDPKALPEHLLVGKIESMLVEENLAWVLSRVKVQLNIEEFDKSERLYACPLSLLIFSH